MSSNPDNTTALQVPAGRDIESQFRDYLQRQHERRQLAGRDIEAELQLQALQTSARFVGDYMRDVRAFDSREQVFDYALDVSKIEGLICEFGVADGHTIRHLACQTAKRIHGFDSFQGLPESWNGFPPGTFACELPIVPKNVVLHQGLFADTLPDFVAYHREPIAFLHIDCDLYSSTKTVFDWLGPQIVSGTIIVFDEFFNYPMWRHHEARAWFEFAMNGLDHQYLCYNKFGEQVALQVL